MAKPAKAILDFSIGCLPRWFDPTWQERGGEVIAFIYCTEEETRVVPNGKFTEAEQEILVERISSALVEAGREIKGLQRNKVM